MVRTYKPKTARNKINDDDVKSAMSEVAAKTLSIRKAANKYKISVSTLQHRFERFKSAGAESSYSSKYTVAQVFTTEQEKKLSEYLINCSKMHYGLTLKQVKVLAYEYAVRLKCKCPESWTRNECAGRDWVLGFRNRNKALSLRKPENTSAARSFAFNKTAVEEFFNNYERVLTKYKFTPDRIINLDETGITTVLPAPKVLAEKTQRQVGQIVSAERGELVTFCAIVTAIGTAVPPVYVFPRVHYKEHFLNGAPEGSLGLANRSGWMTVELHLQVLKHIQRHTSCTVENRVLIICDNHESHISIEAVNYCRNNGIIYMSLPPHTSHKMQPLDIAVFGPFKAKLRIAFNDWHIRNVGKTLNIYNIAELSKAAFLEAFTPKNITSGFSKPGIWPLNRLAFGDDDFAPIEIYRPTSTSEELAAATSQPTQDVTFINMNDSNEITGVVNPALPVQNSDPLDACNQLAQAVTVELPSESPSIEVVPSSSAAVMSPEVVRPYPKLYKQIQQGGSCTKKGREKGKSRVFTDTPEKDRLQKLHEEKDRKQQAKVIKQKAKDLKTAKNLLSLRENPKISKRRRRGSLSELDLDSSHTESIKLSDDEDMDVASVEDKSDDDTNLKTINPENIKINDFLLVKFEKKKTVVYYVAKVLSKYNLTEYQVLYLRKKSGSWVFVFPAIDDKASVDFSDVVLHLPKPTFSKGTSRTSTLYKSSTDLREYNVQ